MDYSPPGSSVRGILQGNNTRVGCHSFLQGIFPTQGSNPCFLRWQVGSLTAEPPGKPLKCCQSSRLIYFKPLDLHGMEQENPTAAPSPFGITGSIHLTRALRCLCL